MKRLAQEKRSFVAACRETGGIESASRSARLRIDPFRDPRRSTDETFAWLREHPRSFLAERGRGIGRRRPVHAPSAAPASTLHA